jgi:hypothetical protein
MKKRYVYVCVENRSYEPLFWVIYEVFIPRKPRLII